MKIELEQVSFSYPNGVQALKDIDLQIQPGELVAIVGQNGAGKTTLVRHLNGLLQPSRGRVLIGGWDTRQRSVSELAARVGYVFQNPDDQLFCRTVREEIRFGPQNLHYAPERIDALAQQAAALTELEDKQDKNPYDLSPTWRKMVALASVLAMDTPVVILDEPTTGQDAVSVLRIARLIQSLQAAGKTVITITHDIDFCAENFERVIAMGQGQILLDGPLLEVIAERELLASTYVEQPQLTRLASRLGFPRTVCRPDEFLQVLRDS